MIQWAPGQTVGPYRLLRKLGAGGMGVVFLAEHTGTGGRLALKVLLDTSDPELVERFRREARAQASVDGHPNVVRVHALHETAGALFLVMDAVTGGDLKQRLDKGPLPVEEAIRTVRAVARGLAHVHARGILHRDLKPANVLFDEHGVPKLVDFGLAFVTEEQRLTQTGTVMGTPTHMAPEQADGRTNDIGPATDVYGLGALLHHCLSGRPPFADPSLLVLLNRVLNEAPPPLRSLRSDVPRALEQVVQRALAKSPEARQPSAEAFVEALDAASDGSAAQRRLAIHLLIVLLVTSLLLVVAIAISSSDPETLPPDRASPEAPAPDPTEDARVARAVQILRGLATAKDTAAITLRRLEQASEGSQQVLIAAFEQAAREWAGVSDDELLRAAPRMLEVLELGRKLPPPGAGLQEQLGRRPLTLISQRWEEAARSSPAEARSLAWELVELDRLTSRTLRDELELPPAFGRALAALRPHERTPQERLDLYLFRVRHDVLPERHGFSVASLHKHLANGEILPLLKAGAPPGRDGPCWALLELAARFSASDGSRLRALSEDERSEALRLLRTATSAKATPAEALGPRWLGQALLARLSLLALSEEPADVAERVAELPRALRLSPSLSDLHYLNASLARARDLPTRTLLAARYAELWRATPLSLEAFFDPQRHAYEERTEFAEALKKNAAALGAALAASDLPLDECEAALRQVFPANGPLRWGTRDHTRSELIAPGFVPFVRRLAISFLHSERVDDTPEGARRFVRAMLLAGRPRSQGPPADRMRRLFERYADDPIMIALQTRHELAKRSPGAAADALRRGTALESSGQDLELLLARIDYLRAIDADPDDVLKLVRDRLESDPTQVQLAIHAAELLLPNGQGALACLKAALAKAPHVVELRRLAARAHLALREPAAAAAQLGALFPGDPQPEQVGRRIVEMWGANRQRAEEILETLDRTHPLLVGEKLGILNRSRSMAGPARDLVPFFPDNPYLWSEWVRFALRQGGRRGRSNAAKRLTHYLRNCLDTSPAGLYDDVIRLTGTD